MWGMRWGRARRGSDRGATSVEYAVIAAVTVVALGGMLFFRGKVLSVFQATTDGPGVIACHVGDTSCSVMTQLGPGNSNTGGVDVTLVTLVEPTTPTLTATARVNSVLLSWTDAGVGVTYSVSGGERITGTNSYILDSGISGQCVTLTVYSCTITGLSPLKTYGFSVTARNTIGARTSLPAFAQPLAPVVDPTAPTLTAAGAVNSVNLSWTSAGSSMTYTVAGGVLVGGSFTPDLTIGSVCVNVTTLTCAVPSLSPSQTYAFKVTAMNAVGVTATSNQATATPTTAGPPAPTAPTLTATPATNSVNLSWTSGGTSVTYTVTGGVMSGGSFTPDATIGAVCVNITAQTCSIPSLDPTKTYGFKVTATNATGSATSNQATATPTASAPAAPTAPVLTATAQVRAIALAWTSGGTSVTYSVSGGVMSGASFTPDAALTSGCSASALSCTISGLDPTKSYGFTVTATNVSGSATSSIASATPQLGAPTAVTLTPGANNTKTISVGWTAPSPAPTSYEVIRWASSSGSTCAVPASGTTSATSATSPYSATGLTKNNWYCFAVRSVVGSVTSDWASAGTAAQAP